MEHFIKTWTHMREVHSGRKALPIVRYRVIGRGKYQFGVTLRREDGTVFEVKYAGSGWVDDRNYSYKACNADGSLK